MTLLPSLSPSSGREAVDVPLLMVQKCNYYLQYYLFESDFNFKT